ncbi:Component of a membrane-bound complex containing the Tor2p kinase [Lecanora helva]
MSLLQNEDFLIWQLRTSYLSNIKDGIGERLITVDTSVLNDPSFRAAGWSPNVADVKRTYSPPIPTAISSDYFAAPPRSAGFAPPGFNDEEDEGGMVTGRGSADTVGPGPNVRRRRRREQHEEDDSSDLSDESDEEMEGATRDAQKIKFAKMPVRDRAGSSPIRSSVMRDGVEVIVTSPSRRSNQGRLRSGSLTSVEAVKQRARRDTTTSSDMSSENEIDPSIFKRRPLNPTKAAKASNLLAIKHEEDERQQMRNLTNTINEDSGEESDRTSLSSGFGQTADSESLLDDIAAGSMTDMPTPLNLSKDSPIKPKPLPTSLLQPLPPARPISTIQPVSLLGQALKAKKSTPRDPIEGFARLSGKGIPDPLYIRIYAPFSERPSQPFDMPLLKNVQDNDSGEKPQVTVAEAIGLALWRYREEDLKPPIADSKLNVNRWTLRMIDDGEVEYDFPALSRTSPIAQFASNNSRGVRGRSREKPYDEFALVEASDAQFRENQVLTPKYEKQAPPTNEEAPESSARSQSQLEKKEPAIEPALRKAVVAPADKPAPPTNYSTPRMGPLKMLKIHFTSLEAFSQISTIEVSTDTYIAEVLDTVCKRWKLDKAHHILKVFGTNTIAPVDRTVEALGTRTDLDLVRRRFANDGALGLAGSPGSSSPNAPLLLAAETPRKGGKRPGQMMHPLAQKQDVLGYTAKYKKYNVIRRQPMSFAASHPRVLLMDEDYMHILPGETGKTLFDSSAKTSRVPFSMIVGCKVSRRHPKTFRVIIIRDKEDTKRYDFEAQTANDASEIVEEIRKGMEPYDQKHHGAI